MTIFHNSRACSSRIAVLACILLFAGLDVHAQTLRVSAANSSNNSVYDVNFVTGEIRGGSVSPLISDASSRSSLVSMVFLLNSATTAVDIVAADTNRNQIVIWPGPTSTAPATGVVFWDPIVDGVPLSSTHGLPGPVSPNGLSLDSALNLFVTSSKEGSNVVPSLWVFPRNLDPEEGPGTLNANYDLPLLVDSDFTGIDGGVRLLAETTVSGVDVDSIVGVDHLLVAASDPALVFSYTKDQITSVLGGGEDNVDPLELISAVNFAGAEPTGIAFWPPDNSLLISTAGGIIKQYDLENQSFQAEDFASGLGNGKFKIKTGVEFSGPIAVIADRNGGEILKFGPPPNNLLASVTSGVEHPQGLALTNVAGVDASACEAALGCDPLGGGVLVHQILNPTGDVEGILLQDPCIVASDPRVNASGVCTGTLSLELVCPGFEDVTIPQHLCGGAGPNNAFAVVQTIAPLIKLTEGVLLATAEAESILPTEPDPDNLGLNAECPEAVLAWAPVPSIEADSVAGNEFDELTGACGNSSSSLRRSASYWLITEFNVAGLPGLPEATDTERLRDFVFSKYDLIDEVIAISTIKRKFAKELDRCFASSRRQFDRGRFEKSLAQLLDVCNVMVRENLGENGAFTSTEVSPNPSAELIGRTANLYLTIDVRFNIGTARDDWPSAPIL